MENRKRLVRWLTTNLDEGNYGLKWVNRSDKTFSIPWMHKSKNDWNEEDGLVFKAWAAYTGHHQQGGADKWARWKGNLRVALKKLDDFEEIKHSERLGNGINPVRIYRIVSKKKQRKSLDSSSRGQIVYTPQTQSQKLSDFIAPQNPQWVETTPPGVDDHALICCQSSRSEHQDCWDIIQNLTQNMSAEEFQSSRCMLNVTPAQVQFQSQSQTSNSYIQNPQTAGLPGFVLPGEDFQNTLNHQQSTTVSNTSQTYYFDALSMDFGESSAPLPEGMNTHCDEASPLCNDAPTLNESNPQKCFDALNSALFQTAAEGCQNIANLQLPTNYAMSNFPQTPTHFDELSLSSNFDKESIPSFRIHDSPYLSDGNHREGEFSEINVSLHHQEGISITDFSPQSHDKRTTHITVNERLDFQEQRLPSDLSGLPCDDLFRLSTIYSTDLSVYKPQVMFSYEIYYTDKKVKEGELFDNDKKRFYFDPIITNAVVAKFPNADSERKLENCITFPNITELQSQIHPVEQKRIEDILFRMDRGFYLQCQKGKIFAQRMCRTRIFAMNSLMGSISIDRASKQLTKLFDLQEFQETHSRENEFSATTVLSFAQPLNPNLPKKPMVRMEITLADPASLQFSDMNTDDRLYQQIKDLHIGK